MKARVKATVALVGLLRLNSVMADDSSYEGTLTYIQSLTSRFTEIHHCQFQYGDPSGEAKPGGGAYGPLYIFSAGELIDQPTVDDASIVFLACARGVNCIAYHQFDNGQEIIKYQQMKNSINISAIANPAKLAGALSHLVDLCGGTSLK
jgi:hypothetical protein